MLLNPHLKAISDIPKHFLRHFPKDGRLILYISVYLQKTVTMNGHFVPIGSPGSVCMSIIIFIFPMALTCPSPEVYYASGCGNRLHDCVCKMTAWPIHFGLSASFLLFQYGERVSGCRGRSSEELGYSVKSASAALFRIDFPLFSDNVSSESYRHNQSQCDVESCSD